MGVWFVPYLCLFCQYSVDGVFQTMGKDVHSHYDDKICNPDAQRYTTRKFQVIKLYLSLWNGIWLTLISIEYGFSYYAEDGQLIQQ